MLLSDLYLWLSYSRVPTPKINKLLAKVSPAQLWDSFSSDGKYLLDEKTFNALKNTRSVDFIERAKQYLSINNINYITRADPIYPEPLAQDEVNPPPVLYYKGDMEVLRKPCFAVVGTRRASKYGEYAVGKIVSELAEHFTIVSGMATGIDGYAHRAALEAGGLTAAVLGSGLFNPTPVSHLKMFDEIVRRGVVVSEYTPDTHATEYTFPHRNRIISGLCRGVLVVEAAESSGSLITVDRALEQGRDVFAVPGDIDKPRSIGTNRLIRQGATAVTSAKDILEYYSINTVKNKKKADVVGLDFTQNTVLEILKAGETSFDTLAEKSGVSVPELNAALSALLIYGLIHERSKGLYCIS